MNSVVLSLIQLGLGAAVCFGGYRLFVATLPLFAFFWGFIGGGVAIATFLGEGFLASITGGIAGLLLGVLLAVLAYFFWELGVIMAAAAVGYSLGQGLMAAINVKADLLTFLVGIGGAFLVALIAYLVKAPKYVVVILTAIGGANLMVTGALLFLGRIPADSLDFATVGSFIRANDSLIWAAVFVGVAVAGGVVQWATTRDFAVPKPRMGLFQE